MQSVAATFICIVPLIIGCTARPAPRSEPLFGQYVGQWPDGTDTLTLNPDGSFDEQFAFPDKHVVSNRGTWSENHDTTTDRIRLSGAMIRSFGPIPARAEWEFRIIQLSPGIELRLENDPDGAMFLRKR
jgi:hypothetical protein